MTPFPSIPPEDITNGQIYAAIMGLAQQAHVTSRTVTQFRKEFDEYKLSQEDLATAWKVITVMARVIKWVGAIGVPFTILWALFTNWIRNSP